jgi:hypothetical protein
MSAPFTGPGNWDHAQDGAHGQQELAVAVWERWAAWQIYAEVSPSGPPWSEGDCWVMPALTGYVGRQAYRSGAYFNSLIPGWWGQGNITQWVDFVIGPLSDDNKSFKMFSVERANVAAGLPAAAVGFRCKKNIADAFVYRAPQAGDIVGPWYFEDWQKYLSVQKWILGAAVNLLGKYGYGFGQSNTSWAGAMALAEGDYEEADDVLLGAQAAVYTRGSLTLSTKRKAYIYKRTGVPFTYSYLNRPCNVDLYVIGSFYEGTGKVYDDQGMSGIEKDEYALSGSEAVEVVNEWRGGDVFAEMGDDLPVWCAEPVGGAISQYKGVFVACGALLKFDFTNAD